MPDTPNPVVLPPPPLRQPIMDKNGIMAPVWVTWFNQLYGRAGGSIAPNTNDIIIEGAFSNDSSNQQAQSQIDELGIESIFSGTSDQSSAELGNLENFVAQLPQGAKNIYYRQVPDWVPTFTGLTTAGTVSIKGSYTRIGNLVYFNALIQPAAASSSSSVLGTTILNNLPYTASAFGTFTVMNSVTRALIGSGEIDSATAQGFSPTWTTVTDAIVIAGIYQVNP